jgi:hypothetical protein
MLQTNINLWMRMLMQASAAPLVVLTRSTSRGAKEFQFSLISSRRRPNRRLTFVECYTPCICATYNEEGKAKVELKALYGLLRRRKRKKGLCYKFGFSNKTAFPPSMDSRHNHKLRCLRDQNLLHWQFRRKLIRRK